MSSAPTNAKRPLRTRLVHSTAEVLLSFALAGGTFLALFEGLCYASDRCDTMGGLAFLLAAVVMTAVCWSGFIALVVRFRDRYRARIALDVAAGVTTAACWLAYLVA